MILAVLWVCFKANWVQGNDFTRFETEGKSTARSSLVNFRPRLRAQGVCAGTTGRACACECLGGEEGDGGGVDRLTRVRGCAFTKYSIVILVVLRTTPSSVVPTWFSIGYFKTCCNLTFLVFYGYSRPFYLPFLPFTPSEILSPSKIIVTIQNSHWFEENFLIKCSFSLYFRKIALNQEMFFIFKNAPKLRRPKEKKHWDRGKGLGVALRRGGGFGVVFVSRRTFVPFELNGRS